LLQIENARFGAGPDLFEAASPSGFPTASSALDGPARAAAVSPPPWHA
jgi:hypothetical protein